MGTFSFRRLLFLLLLLVSLAVTSYAQTATTSLRGDVTDSSGALIQAVAVTLTESSIGFTQTHQTNEKGEYSFQQIPPGSYQIKISAPGFNERTEKAQLLVNQPASINITLTVGSSITTVEVISDTTALNATDATIGTPFNQSEIQSLPFQGNNVLSSLPLHAAVLSLAHQSSYTMYSDCPAGAIHGARPAQSNLTLDGV